MASSGMAEVKTSAATAEAAMYRSDWPEAGLAGPWCTTPSPNAAPDEWCLALRNETAGITLRLRALRNGFESDLYGLECRELRLEIGCADSAAPPSLHGPALGPCLDQALDRFASDSNNNAVYAYARVVPGEPLHAALQRRGFEAAEHRRVYQCLVGDLAKEHTDPPSAMRFVALDQIAAERHAIWRERILALCAASFRTGSSRHFTDPVLCRRGAGTEYIVAVMKLNFKHVPPAGFLLAIDEERDALAGFSVVGRKPGFAPGREMLTQLLSAVDEAYRGQGVYRELSRLLCTRFPRDAKLLNVTHVENRAMQRAYEDSGRHHVADTVVLRRVVERAR